MRKHCWWLACLLVVTLLGVFGCQNQAKPTIGAQKGMEAPNFKSTTLDGSVIDLKELKGDKLILVFWQSISKPAQRELVSLQKLHGELKSTQVITINLGEEKETVEEFLASNSVDLPTIIDDEKHKLADLYRVDYLPTTIFIDAKGIITSVNHEELNVEQIVAEVANSK